MRKNLSLQLLLIAVIGTIIYSNTLNNSFHFDDGDYIVNNPIVKNLLYFAEPLKTEGFRSITGYRTLKARYIGSLTFALNYKLNGLDVTGYHILNLAIHIFNAILVYWFVTLTLRMHDTRYTIHDKDNTPLYPPLARGELKGGIVHHHLIALFSALLFVSHPIQTQAVTYITQRFTSLATFFYLLSHVFYIRFRIHDTKKIHDAGYTIHDKGNTPLCPPLIRGELKGGIVHRASWIMYLGSLLSAVLAMKTKETAFTLPVTIAIYEFMFFTPSLSPPANPPEAETLPPRGGGKGGGGDQGSLFRKRILYLTPLLLTMCIIPVSLMGIDKTLGDLTSGLDTATRAQTDMPRWDYLITQIRVIATYIRLLFLPVNQNLDYDYAIYSSFLDTNVFLSFLLLAFILGIGVYLFYRSRPRYMIHDTRYTIPPFNSPLTKGGHRGVSRITHHVSRIIVFGILWFFITLSVESSIIPTQDVIFEHRMYLPSVGFIMAFSTALFHILQRGSRITERQFDRATVTSTHSPIHRFTHSPFLIYCSAALIILLSVATYTRNKVWLNEISLGEDVVKKSPLNARSHNNLGMAYRSNNLIEKAVEHFEAALKLKPDLVEAHINLGTIYDAAGFTEKAMEHFRTVLKLRPSSVEAYNNIGIIYAKQGRLDAAIEMYNKAISINPYYVVTYNNRGNVFDEMGVPERAIEDYNKIISINPDYAAVYFDRGLTYSRINRPNLAVSDFQRACNMGYEKACDSLKR